MMNISIKFSFIEHMVSEETNFLFSLSTFCIMVSMQPIQRSSGPKIYMADTRLFKEHFYKSFVKISAMSWQQMPFFNFPHFKSKQNQSCHNIQTKEPIFIKTQTFNPPVHGCYR